MTHLTDDEFDSTAAERDEERALYAEMCAAVEAAKNAPTHPAVLRQKMDEINGRARAQERRDDAEAFAGSPEHFDEIWERRRAIGGPRWAMPDTAHSGVDDRCHDVNGRRSM